VSVQNVNARSQTKGTGSHAFQSRIKSAVGDF
jgi:hypothetical protein